MNLAAVQHYAFDNFCYPVDEDTLEINILTGKDVEHVFIVSGDPFAGGIMGGISDGSEIILRAYIKPTPSISQEQETTTNQGENISLEIHGRHDPVIVPRAVVVVESMCALAITDALFANMTSRLDRIQEFYKK